MRAREAAASRMKSAGGGVYAAEEKICGAELAPRNKFSFLTDFLTVTRSVTRKSAKPEKSEYRFFRHK